MKAYIINLKTSTDRRAYMEQIMLSVAHCIDYEFIEAIDGRAMSAQDIREKVNQKKAFQMYGRELRGGEIGCTLSHKNVRKCSFHQRIPAL